MQKRRLGRTGLEVSLLGYGAGAVGGLFTKGTAADQERAAARAIEAGINYFDTAALYGNGESERNLGRVLNALKADVVVGTKVRLSAEHRADVGKAIAQGMDDSLRRMGRDHVDLFQLHNPLVAKDGGDRLAIDVALNEVAPAGRCPRGRRARITVVCSIGRKPPTWAPSSSARWRAVLSPAPPSVTRSPCRSSIRSARRPTSRPTWRAPKSSSRWCARA